MFWKNLAVSSCYFVVCALAAIARRLLAFGITLHSRKFPTKRRPKSALSFSHRYTYKCLCL